MRVLVVEDDATNAKYVLSGLKEAGHVADHARDGMEGLYLATEESYDALVVDRMIPRLDGLAMIQALRASGSKTPVLVLSSLSKVEERVKGLQSGGDDYLTKPFAFSELLARLEALVRRATERPAEQTVLKVADLELNLLTRKAKRAGRNIPLQNREFRLLEYLMRRPEQVITRTMLLEGVWDFHFNPQTNLIDAQISKLRQKIDRGFDVALLHTIRGAGYRLSADA
jgi:two-component system OmpR family response regulator